MSIILHAVYVPHMTQKQQLLKGYRSLISTLTVGRSVTISLLAGTCVRTMHYGVQDVYMHLLALQGPWVGEYVGVSTYPLPQAGRARRRS